MFTYGCWGDILYLFIFILISTNTPTVRVSVSHLQESYLATMANVAPLVTRFSAATANKLYQLFVLYSSPRFLLSKERNQTRLFYLLYILDTILQYQYAGNAQIFYTFVRNRDKVLALRDLTFDAAIQAVSNLQSSEENQSLTDMTTLESPTSPLSDKAKGKLPMANTFVSPSGFKATSEWVFRINKFDEWKQRLPVQVMCTLVEHLAPLIESFCIQHDLNVDTKVLSYLSEQTMVGVLPQPHCIITHSFVHSPPIRSWVSAFLWVFFVNQGTWYMKSVSSTNAEVAKLCPPIWAGTKVKLFGVTIS